MVAGELYVAGDPELVAARQACELALREYNAEPDEGRREQLARGLLAAFGQGSYIRPPFHCDYGWNISIGEDTFANFNLTVLDVVPITIGSRVQIASGVQLLGADHPLGPDERASGRELGRPITIENDVWLGAGAIVCPGVTIGRASVIGAGSVVTRDIPPRVVAVGNPCRVLRQL